MARYTITLDSLLASGYNIFDDTWETFIKEHKQVLCDKIVNHYLFCEIGAETPARFRHYLNTQIRENIDRYNMLYESALWDFAPLYNTWVETGTDATVEDKATANMVSMHSQEGLKRMATSLLQTGSKDQTDTTGSNKQGDKHWTEHDESVGTENETIDRDKNETWSENTKTVVDGTEDFVGKTTEEMEDTAKRETLSKKDSKTNSTTTGSTQQYSSDTPQGRISGGAVQIDTEFLTNFSHSNETSTTNSTLTETIDTTEDYTENKSTVTDTTNNTTKHSDTDSTTTGERDTTDDTTRKLDTTETVDKRGDESFTEEAKTDFHGVTGTESRSFEDGSETQNETGAKSATSDTKKSTSTEELKVSKGNVGVSRARLVAQYREAFVDVDLLIINELANNFMGVF